MFHLEKPLLHLLLYLLMHADTKHSKYRFHALEMPNWGHTCNNMAIIHAIVETSDTHLVQFRLVLNRIRFIAPLQDGILGIGMQI